MRVSRNEMVAALARAYEGAGYDIGDYEDAAQLISWSQMCGLGGFDAIPLPPVPPKGDATPRLVFENDDIAVIDAGGAEICEHGSLAAHLAASKARTAGVSIVELANCRVPALILYYLSRIAQRGVYISAYWTDRAGSHGASFEGGASFPHYWRIETALHAKEMSSVTILCTIRPALLADAVTRQAEHPEMPRSEISAAQFSAHYANALEHGLDIPEDRWEALNEAAWPILVPTDSQSRTGAGPG